MISSMTIDGVEVPVQEGQTIIEAARAAGIYIEHLCYNPALTAHGSCKMCTVAVDGKLATACTYPARPGQRVESNTEPLMQKRKALVEMLFAEGNHYCPFCPKSGSCDLQALAYHLKMDHSGFSHCYPQREIDASHPDLVIDRDRCIFCGLCVHASEELDGKQVFDLAGRGTETRLQVNSVSGRLEDSDIDIDDAAAHICPVGAIMPKDGNYRTPIGKRYFDELPIEVSDNASGKL